MKNADKKIKLRFWQKAYLLTLALFLLCINGGILSLTVYTHGENVKAAEEAAKAQQYYVAVSFERDMEYLAENGGSAALLMEAFGAHYKDKGLFIAVEKDGVILYSDFPEASEIEGNSLRHADLILVLTDGGVLGAGTHAQLMESCEEYRYLAQIQMGDREEA